MWFRDGTKKQFMPVSQGHKYYFSVKRIQNTVSGVVTNIYGLLTFSPVAKVHACMSSHEINKTHHDGFLHKQFFISALARGNKPTVNLLAWITEHMMCIYVFKLYMCVFELTEGWTRFVGRRQSLTQQQRTRTDFTSRTRPPSVHHQNTTEAREHAGVGRVQTPVTAAHALQPEEQQLFTWWKMSEEMHRSPHRRWPQ